MMIVHNIINQQNPKLNKLNDPFSNEKKESALSSLIFSINTIYGGFVSIDHKIQLFECGMTPKQVQAIENSRIRLLGGMDRSSKDSSSAPEVTVEDVLTKFGNLSMRQQAKQLLVFQRTLDEAYLGERALCLMPTENGLGPNGGVLLGEFLKKHPHIEELHLAGSMLNESSGGTTIEDGSGFDAFLAGLTEMKELQLLDLSNDVYSPEQLGRLAEQFLMDHPTLTTLMFNSSFITVKHLAAMIPFLSCPQLKKIQLRGNAGYLKDNELVFNQLVDKLLNDCPALQWIDVSGNSSLQANGPAAQALMRLITINKQVFVRMPQDQNLYQQSMKNHCEHFVPNQILVMMSEFKQIQEQFQQFSSNAQALPEILTVMRRHEARFEQHEARLAQHQARIEQQEVRFEQMDDYIKALSSQCEETQKQTLDLINQQCLKQILLEQQGQVIQADIEEFKTSIKTMQGHIKTTETHIFDLEARAEELTTEGGETKQNMMLLKQALKKQKNLLEDIEERMDEKLAELRTEMVQIAAKMEKQWSDLSPTLEIIPSELNFTLTEQAYIKKFKQMLVQMHIVAMAASEGSFQLTHTGSAGIAAAVCNIVGGLVPWGGGAATMLSYLLQSVDEAITKQRMIRIMHLGEAPDDVAQLATAISYRLVRCLTIENRIEEGCLAKLFSTTSDVIQSYAQNGFYGALFSVVQDGEFLTPLTRSITQVITPTEIEVRAEIEAKLLLAAIAEDDVPRKASGVDVDKLFLYSAPLFTLIDSLFSTILTQFCVTNSCQLDNLSMKPQKKAAFYSHIAQSWKENAENVSQRIEDSEKRVVFIDALARAFINKTYPGDKQGVFYFNPRRLSVFSGSKRHASIHNEAITLEIANELLQIVLTSA